MTNHLDAVRRLAVVVARGNASTIAVAIFKAYAAAAGANISGAWVYVPDRATPIKGFRRFAQYVADLDETSRFLNDLANAHDAADRELGVPFVDVPLGQQVIRAADLTPLPPSAAELNTLATRVGDAVHELLGAVSRPAPAPDPETVVVPLGAELGELLAADARVTQRVVKRAKYDALRTMLDVLNGWIEGAHENADAGSGSHADAEQFHADDIRRMVNDAAREHHVREPYRPTS